MDDILSYIFDNGLDADFKTQINMDVDLLTAENRWLYNVYTDCQKHYKTKGQEVYKKEDTSQNMNSNFTKKMLLTISTWRK